jgi:hypothetical protein
MLTIKKAVIENLGGLFMNKLILRLFGAGDGIRARDLWYRAFSPLYLQIMSLAP